MNAQPRSEFHLALVLGIEILRYQCELQVEKQDGRRTSNLRCCLHHIQNIEQKGYLID